MDNNKFNYPIINLKALLKRLKNLDHSVKNNYDNIDLIISDTEKLIKYLETNPNI